MNKRILATVLSVVTAASIMIGCSSSSGAENDGGTTDATSKLKVGMVTDSGTIDDKSFNQGTWAGIEKAKTELGIDSKFLKPAGNTEADYIKEIGNLYDAGYKFIITPGFKFESAVYQGQEKYNDAKFVLLDGTPNKGDGVGVVGPNTVSIYFAEQEAGFLAGVAAAVQLKEGDLGFVGGLEIPAVQRFNWGYQQGVDYANKNLGTKMTIKPENIVYVGDFNNAAAGQQISAQMFDRGVKAVFTAAGATGVGAITEAKARVASGKEAWIIGVDVDQYSDGIYEGNKSVILTSAIKFIDEAAYHMIKAEVDGTFPGGQTLNFDVKNDGVGIPKENPNLNDETMKIVDDIYAKIKLDEIKVSKEQGNLIK